MSICPHCGAYTDKLIIIPHSFGSIERRVVEALPLDGEGMTLAEIIEVVYGDRSYSRTGRNNSVDQRKGVVLVVINRLRKKLPSLGWTIPKIGGHRGTVARFKLERRETT